MKLSKNSLMIVQVLSGFFLTLALSYKLIIKFIIKIILNYNIPDSASSIGIIGGADGPTSIFIASTYFLWSDILRYIIIAFSAILFFISSVKIFKMEK